MCFGPLEIFQKKKLSKLGRLVRDQYQWCLHLLRKLDQKYFPKADGQSKSVPRYLIEGVFGFAELFVAFFKHPKSFHEISIQESTLKKATTLYLASGAINFYSMSKLNGQIEEFLGEPTSISIAFETASSPIIGELIQAMIGLIFLVVMIPASLILRSKNAGRSFNEMMLFFFSIGSVGAGIYSFAVLLSALPGFSVESAGEILDAYFNLLIFPPLAMLLFAPLYLINLKHFSTGRSWPRVVTALGVSIVIAIPLNISLQMLASNL